MIFFNFALECELSEHLLFLLVVRRSRTEHCTASNVAGSVQSLVHLCVCVCVYVWLNPMSSCVDKFMTYKCLMSKEMVDRSSV